MFKSIRLVIAFTASMDSVPGWGHEAKDWIDLATNAFLRNSHYDTSAEVLSITEMRKSFNETSRKYEHPKFVTEPEAITTFVRNHCDGTFNDDPSAWNFISTPVQFIAALEPYQVALERNKVLESQVAQLTAELHRLKDKGA
jgi:hypothetical protein